MPLSTTSTTALRTIHTNALPNATMRKRASDRLRRSGSRRKETGGKPAKTRKPAREEAADEADDELEVGDEVDDEEGGRRDIHAGGDDDSEESGETDDDPFTHPVLLEAKSYGFSEEEAREFGTVDALQKAMEIIDRNLKKLAQEPKPDAANDAAARRLQPVRKPVRRFRKTASIGRIRQDSGRTSERREAR